LRESDIAKVGKTKKLTNGNDENKCKERRRKESSLLLLIIHSFSFICLFSLLLSFS
jgi:hypothetical protein